jgi:hypothetical protein
MSFLRWAVQAMKDLLRDENAAVDIVTVRWAGERWANPGLFRDRGYSTIPFATVSFPALMAARKSL